ncbi:MAG: T9SS type A sorting domain-containing protein, partial [Prolixibacteraceae bacterium]|nr:T9SS type A sorting domain-containing protein [Prolixibacteraceae bacterium]
NWNNYVNTLENADKIVADFWETIQQDDFYKEKTTMIVTNDHGRHDDAHGGFQGHGCGCSGCRRIMFLAVGPNIKKNYVSTQTRRIPDVAVTAASILGVNMEYSSGEVTTEIFESTEISKLNNSISWLVTPSEIRVNIQNKSKISLSVYNITGKKVKEIANNLEVSHHQNFNWNNNLNEGIYFIRLMIDGIKETKKVVVLN